MRTGGIQDRTWDARRRPVAVVVRAPRTRAWRLRGILGLAALCSLAVVGSGTGYGYGPPPPNGASAAIALPEGEDLAKMRSTLRSKTRRLERTLTRLAPRGKYVVVDQTQNRIYLRDGDRVLLEAACSAGSGMILKEEAGRERKWVFDTPRGVFRVRNRVKDPVWKKPDWAFIEEGKPIPRNPSERIEYGTLGEYAFYLGDGYMIHGTLYERLLGRSVTHGCIRVGKEDLRVLWREVGVGTRVYIY